MSVTIEAVYDGKVFLPIDSIQIKPNTRVKLTVRNESEFISASDARRAANRRLFGDRVGTALSSKPPLWSADPEPHWEIPYHFFDGTPFISISVNAKSGNVLLSEQEREAILSRLEAKLNTRYATA